MTTIYNTYINALLADATYALDNTTIDGLNQELLEAKLSDRMTPTLAKYIGKNFTVVTHIESSDIFGSGFDATVWKDNNGKYYLSMQGTTGLEDFLTDIDLTLHGAANKQIETMVNWWLKNTTPEGRPVTQVMYLNGTYIPTFQTEGTGILSNVTSLSVNGHSLGGHLATAFTRLFGGHWNIDHTYTYNSAGFTTNSDSVFSKIELLLDDGFSMGRFPDQEEQSNFFAKNGINVTTRTYFGGQEGRRIPLFNEEGTGIPNHLMYKLTDSLAVIDLISQLSPSLSIGTTEDVLPQINNLFETSSNNTQTTLEDIVRILRRTFKASSTNAIVTDDRDILHQAILDVRASSSYKKTAAGQNGQAILVDISTYSDPAVLAANAKGNIAFRYALQHLDPFVFQNVDPIYVALDESNELDSSNFTDNYLQDRAAMLLWKLRYNQEDKAYSDSFNTSEITDDWDYIDNTTVIGSASGGDPLKLTIDGNAQTSSTNHQIIFGSDNIDTLIGDKLEDHLYGGKGDDTLVGGDGADYLEGGDGFDTYNTMDGDTLFDSDGQGRVIFENNPLQGGTRQSNGSYRSGDGIFTYRLANNTLTVSGFNKTLTIKNFTPGDLGISLSEATTPADPTNVITGTNKADQLMGENKPTIFQGLGGSDWIWGHRADDRLYGGDDGDRLEGGHGDDLLVGEAGNDILWGGDGNDRLFVDNEVTDLAAFVTQHASGSGSGQQGEWASGGLGDDTVVGGTGNDVLLGGGGTDYIFGGKGHDRIDGDNDYYATDFNWTVSSASNPFDFVVNPILNLNDARTVGAADVIHAGAGEDKVIGGMGNDVIFGEGDNDYLAGGDGSDYISGGEGNDKITGEYGHPISVTLESVMVPGNDFIDGGAGDDELWGEKGNDQLWGGIGQDKLHGDEGDDTLVGGGDADYLEGGEGFDTYQAGDGDTLLDIDGQGRVIFEDLTLQGGTQQEDGSYLDDNSVFTYRLTSGTLTVTNSSKTLIINNFTSGDLGITLTKEAEETGETTESYLGTEEDDQLEGGAGDDTLLGYQGNDTLFGNAGNDKLYGHENDDQLFGGPGKDRLFGAEGDDILDGGADADYLDGGIGNDTYYVDNAGDVIHDHLDVYSEPSDSDSNSTEDTVVTFSGGDDTVYSSISYVLPFRVENLILTAPQAIEGTGNLNRNHIEGNDLDNVLYAYRTDGKISLDSTLDVIYAPPDWLSEHNERAAELFELALHQNRIPYAVVEGDSNRTLRYTYTPADGDTLIGHAGDDRLYGDINNDILDGGEGDDFLYGQGGADVLIGGNGDDTYLITGTLSFGMTFVIRDNCPSYDINYLDAESEDTLQEMADAGDDTVISTISYTLPENVENLVFINDTSEYDIGVYGEALYQSQAEYGIGNELNNIIKNRSFQNMYLDGGAGDDLLIGGIFSDTLYGGAGYDTLQGGDGDDTYIIEDNNAIDPVTIPDSTDSIKIRTLSGNNAIDGTGNKLNNAIIEGNSDIILETASGGRDTVESCITYTLGANLEILTLTGDKAIDGTGNELNNVIQGNDAVNRLTGGAGHDTLIGGADADFMAGGTGDDTYYVDNPGDVTLENPDEGYDQVHTTVSYVLGDNLEALYLQGDEDIDGTGNDNGNRIDGNDGNNRIDGLSGSDELQGGGGDDELIGGDGNDRLLGDNINLHNDYHGNDILDGGAGDDILMGQGGNDLLNGGDGDDTLDGGTGADQMTGGAGDDFYIVDNTDDTLIEAADEGIDRVESSVTIALADNIEHLTLTGEGWIDGQGNDADNTLIGNIGANTLEGGAGNDHLDGDSENDTLLGGDGNDWLYGGDDYADSYDYYGGSVNVLPNDDHLDGGDGDDWLDGGSGNDVLLGGEGDDIIYGGDDGEFGEYLSNNDYLDGGAGSDTLDGGSGHDVLNGGTGIDHMTGGSGNDTYYVDGYTETITEPGDPGDGNDGVPGSDQPPCDCADGQPGKGNEGVGNGEDPPPPGHDDNWNDGPGTSPGNPGRKGGAKSNGHIVVGHGGSGSGQCGDHGENGDGTPGGGDTPPEGDDGMVTRTVWHTDEVTEQAGGGYDVVHASATYTLTPFVEELHLIGSEAIDGTGNDQDNRLYGNSAANRLDGGAGIDELWGGLGNDIYVVDNEFDRIYEYTDQGQDTVQSSVSYTLGEHLENLELLGEEDISGQGNAGDNILTGNAGNNLLDGGSGDDIYQIGYYGGIDLLQDAAGDDVVEFSALVTPDHVVARTTTFDGTTTAHIRLLDANGNELADQGADIILGTTESTQSPIERFRFSDGSEVTLDDLLIRTETYFGSHRRDTITTGRNDDTIHAGAGTDEVYAGGANDVLYGEAGDDTLFGEAGNDHLLGGDDDDALYGGAGNDLLQGGTGNDRLSGCLGADIHIGGIGNDELLLESGDDVVLYNNGDGRDTLHFGEHATAVTISLGGIALDDVLLERDGDDLVIGFGEEADKHARKGSHGPHGLGHQESGIVLDNWFELAEDDAIPDITLQLIEETDMAPDIGDPSYVIARFDFAAVAAAFTASGDHTDSWSIVDAALEAHLGDSDSEAIGGALAYRYAVDGTLDQVNQDTISALLANRQLGREPQSVVGA